jgi:hypothetical protein
LRFKYTMFTLQIRFKQLLLGWWVGGGDKLTVNSKEENSYRLLSHLRPRFRPQVQWGKRGAGGAKLAPIKNFFVPNTSKNSASVGEEGGG